LFPANDLTGERSRLDSVRAIGDDVGNGRH